jgi:hypothetical protein
VCWLAIHHDPLCAEQHRWVSKLGANHDDFEGCCLFGELQLLNTVSKAQGYGRFDIELPNFHDLLRPRTEIVERPGLLVAYCVRKSVGIHTHTHTKFRSNIK